MLLVSCLIIACGRDSQSLVTNSDLPTDSLVNLRDGALLFLDSSRYVKLGELALLSLPIDLEKLPYTKPDVSPMVVHPGESTSEAGTGYTVYGLLQDTSRFYVVLWLDQHTTTPNAASDLKLTTLTKDGRAISTSSVRTSGDRKDKDCHSEGKRTSMINQDLSFKSSYRGVLFCSGEESQWDSDISGKINEDGTITRIDAP